ncbi:hypothetical protein A3C23_00285 [Candidatus Roizmanbacteria bacterium RIFCSPHIGHO2_02_FULL_37_13b]|uniref:GIY-YIG domain-containing protein n=1 Tax=Candidatus Roizmanbacteria bacterium RIFCSPLOWO2_02_FULL_36_11 TaxID=1802071 RepID=A0A1F7JHQ8_9BACT|nr:MAG: hypothetical protein A3C23_00285 [Candidatus Roizmanbacteria bacterium RIFCSPHIGHO2_02_FULL_37_13b]OGK55135.1 MAG: hypothetical protein A3H78_04095 [Candidatus Roizmanbacteria bacterium RIFCSPLOWO2_02_FULL_36_11]
MTYFVYILLCSDNTYYTGCTNNLDRRLKEHNNSKKGAHYTKIRRPVKLVYKKEFKILKNARRREKEIKNWTRERKKALLKEFE